MAGRWGEADGDVGGVRGAEVAHGGGGARAATREVVMLEKRLEVGRDLEGGVDAHGGGRRDGARGSVGHVGGGERVRGRGRGEWERG